MNSVASCFTRGIFPLTRTFLQSTRRRAMSYTPMSPPRLFDLCVRQAFDAALERIRTHPHEARFKHPRNWTALHCCVEHVAPLELVKAIYQAHPESLTAKDWQGITPQEAAVDLETKEFLKQETAQRREHGHAVKATPERNSAMLGIHAGAVNDPVLLGKILAHATNLSEQISNLQKTTTGLQREVEQLMATLKAIESK
jgi:hypothetical protein